MCAITTKTYRFAKYSFKSQIACWKETMRPALYQVVNSSRLAWVSKWGLAEILLKAYYTLLQTGYFILLKAWTFVNIM